MIGLRAAILYNDTNNKQRSRGMKKHFYSVFEFLDTINVKMNNPSAKIG